MKLKKLKKGKKKAYKSRYQAGGMYGSNTVSSSGQGNIGNTSNIVYQESNPAILEEKLKAKKDNEQLLMQQSSDMAAKVEQMDAQAEVDIQTAADKVKAKDQATSSIIQGSIKAGKTTGLIDKKAGSLGIGEGLETYKSVKAAKNTMKTVEGFNKAKTAFDVSQRLKQGEQAYKVAQSMKNVKDITSTGIKTAGTLGKGVSLAGTSGSAFGTGTSMAGTTLKGAQLGTTLTKEGTLMATEATKAAASGSAAGAGLSALNNANVYALAANYAGKGIKSLSDDDDATTWTAGEATGDVLSKAGEYAGYGATLGSVVPGLGNVVGAGIGAVIGTGVGVFQGLTGRKKARKAEADALALRKEKIGKYNEKLGKSFASQKARVNAAQLAQKTYSGYDLGQNVVARKGGMRMGMPRYGYAA